MMLRRWLKQWRERRRDRRYLRLCEKMICIWSIEDSYERYRAFGRQWPWFSLNYDQMDNTEEHRLKQLQKFQRDREILQQS